jgi:hypothetical protein
MIVFVEIIPILRIYNAILFSRQLPDAGPFYSVFISITVSLLQRQRERRNNGSVLESCRWDVAAFINIDSKETMRRLVHTHLGTTW